MPSLADSIAAQVQHNCHITDARHGTSAGLCTYLLRMREFYRWERALDYRARLPKDAVGDWIAGREAEWDALAAQEFRPIEIAGRAYDPFDADGINEALLPSGLAYGGGLGHGCHPTFFLAEVEREETSEGLHVVITGHELARDLAAPPALTGGNWVFVRRESLRRLIWERLENWRFSRLDNPMGRALACFPFDRDPEGALDAMTEIQLRQVLWHELGEHRVGRELGEAWPQIVAAVGGTPTELMLRALRDHWADALTTLPALAAEGRPEAIHFYAGNLSGMRALIAPSIRLAYDRWLADGDASPLAEAASHGQRHWPALWAEVRRRAAAGDPAQAIGSLVKRTPF